jgi:hypothetical protein
MSLVNLDNQAIYLKSVTFSDGTTQIPPVVYRYSVPDIDGLVDGNTINTVFTTPIPFEAGVYLVEHNIAIGSSLLYFDAGVGGTQLSVVGRQSGDPTGAGGNPVTAGNPSNSGVTTVFKCPHCSVYTNPISQPLRITSGCSIAMFGTYQAGGELGGVDYTGLMSFTITKIG